MTTANQPGGTEDLFPNIDSFPESNQAAFWEIRQVVDHLLGAIPVAEEAGRPDIAKEIWRDLTVKVHQSKDALLGTTRPIDWPQLPDFN